MPMPDRNVFPPPRTVRVAIPAAAIALLAVAGCSTPPQPAAPAPLTGATPAQKVAAIRAAAGDGDGELAVQPLRDTEVEDLRERAARLEAQGHLDDAAQALDQAIAIVADDPALLQERAEVALLQGDYARAAALATRAHGIGSQVGPLCRRHWATIEQVRLHDGDAAAAAQARAQVAACRVAAPNRY